MVKEKQDKKKSAKSLDTWQKRSAQTRKEKYGADWFSRIGRKGGKATRGIDWATRGVAKGPKRRQTSPQRS